MIEILDICILRKETNWIFLNECLCSYKTCVRLHGVSQSIFWKKNSSKIARLIV